MRIALLTCAELPEPDPDEPLLLAALRRLGVSASLLAWDDPGSQPGNFDLCILRSTWNYYHQPRRFLNWLRRAANESRLLNPFEIVQWNHDKRYLETLAAAGVPIVPTAFVARGATLRLSDLLSERGWEDVVIKPTISAASWSTRRFGPGTREEAQAFLESIVSEREAMVQPYLPSVENEGERSLMWIDGRWTHAIRKSPRFAGQEESVSGALPVTEAERALGEAALACVPGAEELLYARVDVMRSASGEAVISELELIEPSLFLLQDQAALSHFAEAIVKRVRS